MHTPEEALLPYWIHSGQAKGNMQSPASFLCQETTGLKMKLEKWRTLTQPWWQGGIFSWRLT